MIPLFFILCLLAPTHGFISIPPAPSDPKLTKGDSAGPYNSKSAGVKDHLSKAKFTFFAKSARIKYKNASKNLIHYLGNTGWTAIITPESIMKDVPKFRSAVSALAQNEATKAYKRVIGKNGFVKFSSKWNTFKASGDWFYALGTYSYSVTGVVARSNGKGSLKYKVYIFDRYNWNKNQSTNILGFTFYDNDLGNLHLKGLAKEYVVRGSSQINIVKPFTAKTVIPQPITNSPRRGKT